MGSNRYVCGGWHIMVHMTFSPLEQGVLTFFILCYEPLAEFDEALGTLLRKMYLNT